MEKNDFIQEIIPLLEKLMSDYTDDVCISNIYGKKIDYEYCSRYGVQVSIATFGRNGPHIFMKLKNRIGFGVVSSNIGFNKGLYDKGKLWAELLSPDFICIFSEMIAESEFNNELFQEHKDILLNGFAPDPKDPSNIKIIPITIFKVDTNRKFIIPMYYDYSLEDIIKGNIYKNRKIKGFVDTAELSLEECYVLGNLFIDFEKYIDISADTIILNFSNRLLIKNKLKPAVIKLKMFNNIRNLERKLRTRFNESTFSFEIGKTESLEVDNLQIRITMKNSLSRKINNYSINSKDLFAYLLIQPPIYLKWFIKGFVDANYAYLGDNYYSDGGGLILKNEDYEKLESLLNKISISRDRTGEYLEGIDNTVLEVRKSPFVQQNILKIINYL